MIGKASELNEDDMMGDTEEKTEEKKASPELITFPEREVLETKLTEAEDKALRAIAEMENIRRRSEQRIAEAHKYAIAKLLEELVPVLDSLEQSLTVQQTDHTLVNSMREGMAMTLQILLKTLEKFGVKEINPVNEVFNPVLHEVMGMQETADVPANTIIAVLRKGYQLHDRLIRPASVMIAKAPA